jgi:phosphatidylserine/phosphatidylglycerophosphate/cardiolipin synthase-like enzyme
MAGILLSTGTTGSEGTLGGLVEQGRRIKYHLGEALRRAKLCSHDPVCARPEPTQSPPGRALLGAACHGCLFVAECSCERSNQYLDRALVVPTKCIIADREKALVGSANFLIRDHHFVQALATAWEDIEHALARVDRAPSATASPLDPA